MERPHTEETGRAERETDDHELEIAPPMRRNDGEPEQREDDCGLEGNTAVCARKQDVTHVVFRWS